MTRRPIEFEWDVCSGAASPEKGCRRQEFLGDIEQKEFEGISASVSILDDIDWEKRMFRKTDSMYERSRTIRRRILIVMLNEYGFAANTTDQWCS